MATLNPDDRNKPDTRTPEMVHNYKLQEEVVTAVGTTNQLTPDIRLIMPIKQAKLTVAALCSEAVAIRVAPVFDENSKLNTNALFYEYKMSVDSNTVETYRGTFVIEQIINIPFWLVSIPDRLTQSEQKNLKLRRTSKVVNIDAATEGIELALPRVTFNPKARAFWGKFHLDKIPESSWT